MAITPPTEETFLHQLRSLFRSCIYSPPELELSLWHELHAILVSNLPTDVEYEKLLETDPRCWQILVSLIVNPSLRMPITDPTAGEFMSMSTYILGYKPTDEKWKEMKAAWDAWKKTKVAWDACKATGV
jgi:hypothetical protein